MLATTAAYVLGALMLWPMTFVMAPLFPSPDFRSPSAWAVIAYQAFLGAIAHVWWYEGVRTVVPTRRHLPQPPAGRGAPPGVVDARERIRWPR